MYIVYIYFAYPITFTTMALTTNGDGQEAHEWAANDVTTDVQHDVV